MFATEQFNLLQENFQLYKIVINEKHGRFNLSAKALERLLEIAPRVSIVFGEPELPRHDLRLVQLVEELGDEASGSHSKLVIKEIEGAIYQINEYDGFEYVVEPKDMKWITI